MACRGRDASHSRVHAGTGGLGRGGPAQRHVLQLVLAGEGRRLLQLRPQADNPQSLLRRPLLLVSPVRLLWRRSRVSGPPDRLCSQQHQDRAVFDLGGQRSRRTQVQHVRGGHPGPNLPPRPLQLVNWARIPAAHMGGRCGFARRMVGRLGAGHRHRRRQHPRAAQPGESAHGGRAPGSAHSPPWRAPA